jgi:hypothetical protein
MPNPYGDPDQWLEEFDRRHVTRTRISKGALIFASRRFGVQTCTVGDVTNSGAGIRTHDITILPPTFDLSFDNFRTIRNCRLVWRAGDYIGAAFET